jgi:acyl carrier protein phosphodiesterase
MQQKEQSGLLTSPQRVISVKNYEYSYEKWSNMYNKLQAIRNTVYLVIFFLHNRSSTFAVSGEYKQ